MTLSQYIGSYLYSPIQFWISRRRQERGKKVSRKAQATIEGFTQMIAFPTILTMFIAGIWHGAGFQFLVFGFLHGVYLTINHGWRIFRHQRGIKAPEGLWRLPTRGISVLLTFSCVLSTLVFFRAADIHEAMLLLKRMAFTHIGETGMLVTVGHSSGDVMRVAVGFVIVWVFPNTQQILARYRPSLALAPPDQEPGWLPIFWEPNLTWALVLGFVAFVSAVKLQNPSSFLYFQF